MEETAKQLHEFFSAVEADIHKVTLLIDKIEQLQIEKRIDGDRDAQEWLILSKTKLLHVAFYKLQNDVGKQNALLDLLKQTLRFEVVVNFQTEDVISDFLWTIHCSIMDSKNDEFRENYQKHMMIYRDVCALLATRYMQTSPHDVTEELLTFLCLKKTSFLMKKVDKPQGCDSLLRWALPRTNRKILLKFLIENVEDVPLQNPSAIVGILLSPLQTEKDEIDNNYETKLLITCLVFDLVTFHRLEFLAQILDVDGTPLEKQSKSVADCLMEEFYTRFEPRLFASGFREEFLSRLCQLSKIFSQKYSLLFFKKALRIALIVQAHSAVWLLNFSKLVFLQNPIFLFPALHINPSLAPHFALGIQEKRQIYQELFTPNTSLLRLPRMSDSQIPVSDSVKLVVPYSAQELILLIRHHDRYVSATAKGFMDTILLPTSAMEVNRALHKSMHQGLWDLTAHSINPLLARCAALGHD